MARPVPPAPPITRRRLSWWVRHSDLKLQTLLFLVILVTVFARVAPLEMQKRIVNEAIFLGDIDLLLRYCGIYLAAVLLASGLKYVINILQALIGQRALAEMRKALYHHLLTLPLNFFRKTQPGMVVASLVSELAAAGDFVGLAVAVPVINLLTLLAFGVYLFWLNPLLAAVSLAIYPAVLILVPMLQRRVNRTNKERVDTTRTLSDKIAETVSGIHEVHANATYGIENRKYDDIVESLRKNRVVWSLFKDGVKVVNNLFNNLSPFFIFILGGYLTIRGQLELGSLVAFLSAQEKLFDPWKELLDFYQAYQDATVRYHRTMEYYDMESEIVLEPDGREPYDLDGRVEVRDLSFFTDSGIQLLDRIGFELEAGEQLAVVGFSGSGKSTLAQCIAQLYKYDAGHIRIGDREVNDLTKRDMARVMGLVSQAPYIFSGTIEENLLYACAPLVEEREENGEENAGPSLDDMIAVLQQTGIFVDVLRFGLNAVLDPATRGELIERTLRVREAFRESAGEDLSDSMEFYREDRYLRHAGVAENLLFGTTGDADFETPRLPRNEFFRRFLDAADLNRPLLNLGAELARRTVDILGDLPPDEVFFEWSPIPPDELDAYRELAERLGRKRLHELKAPERERLLELALRFAPGRHKMVAMPDLLKSLLLEGRALFRDMVLEEMPDRFDFHDPSRYIPGETLRNNILFGRTTTDNAKARERIDQRIIRILIEEDLLETVLRIGMQFQVGSKGDRLSGGQRQKLAIARIFLKAPKLLVMDEATSALDNASQARIQNLVETRWKGRSTVIAVIHRLDIVRNYDRVAVMKAGKIEEIGPYEELMERKGLLHELVHGKR
jgi:ABC-type multidrug transport system fused ATPase/permease subunit